MGERSDAKRSIESSTRHMSEIAEELSRRASPRYIGEQVREKALDKTQQWKESFISSPTALGLIGGVLGAAVGRAFARNRHESQFRRREFSYGSDFRYGGDFAYRDGPQSSDRYRAPDGGGVREKIAGGAQELKDKASEVVSDVREHIPSVSELGRKAEDNPAVIALGGLALGAIAALLLPVSRKEREMLEPVKQRAGEAIGALGSQIAESANQVQEKVAGPKDQGPKTGGYTPPTDPSPLTH